MRAPGFADRRDAGRQLAAALVHLKPEHPLVLALPRGGVPVAVEVGAALDAELDLLLVRKIGAPGFPELGLGAVVEGSPCMTVYNENIMQAVGPSAHYLQTEEARQVEEIARRRRLYCGDRPAPSVSGRTVVLVDDGIATGGTVAAALRGLENQGAARLVLAIPVAPLSALERLQAQVAECVCLMRPADFRTVGAYYADFAQTSDEEVVSLLKAARAGR